jgi:hypothetical protein
LGDSGFKSLTLNRRYNCENGGPAPEKLTDAIFANTKTISRYYSAQGLPDVDIGKLGSHSFLVQHKDDKKFGAFIVEVGFVARDFCGLCKTDRQTGPVAGYRSRAFFRTWSSLVVRNPKP